MNVDLKGIPTLKTVISTGMFSCSSVLGFHALPDSTFVSAVKRALELMSFQFSQRYTWMTKKNYWEIHLHTLKPHNRDKNTPFWQGHNLLYCGCRRLTAANTNWYTDLCSKRAIHGVSFSSVGRTCAPYTEAIVLIPPLCLPISFLSPSIKGLKPQKRLIRN